MSMTGGIVGVNGYKYYIYSPFRKVANRTTGWYRKKALLVTLTEVGLRGVGTRFAGNVLSGEPVSPNSSS